MCKAYNKEISNLAQEGVLTSRQASTSHYHSKSTRGKHLRQEILNCFSYCHKAISYCNLLLPCYSTNCQTLFPFAFICLNYLSNVHLFLFILSFIYFILLAFIHCLMLISCSTSLFRRSISIKYLNQGKYNLNILYI